MRVKKVLAAHLSSDSRSQAPSGVPSLICSSVSNRASALERGANRIEGCQEALRKSVCSETGIGCSMRGVGVF